MKKHIAQLIIVGTFLTGCATSYTEKRETDTNGVVTVTIDRTRLLFSKEIVKGRKVDSKTKTSSSLLSVQTSETSVDSDGINAASVMLKAGIEGAVAGAVKGAK